MIVHIIDYQSSIIDSVTIDSFVDNNANVGGTVLESKTNGLNDLAVAWYDSYREEVSTAVVNYNGSNYVLNST